MNFIHVFETKLDLIRNFNIFSRICSKKFICRRTDFTIHDNNLNIKHILLTEWDLKTDRYRGLNPHSIYIYNNGENNVFLGHLFPYNSRIIR